METRRQKIERMLAAEPGDVFLNFGLAMELTKEKAFDAALTSFDRVISLDADYTAAYHHKAATLSALSRYDEARATIDAGIQAARRIGNGHAESELNDLLLAMP